jgi:hypothetical protein
MPMASMQSGHLHEALRRHFASAMVASGQFACLFALSHAHARTSQQAVRARKTKQGGELILRRLDCNWVVNRQSSIDRERQSADE